MFDQNKKFTVGIYSGGAVKRCLVRWPVDQEWTANAAKRTLITEAKGDGTVIRAEHLKADGELFRRIRIKKEHCPESEDASQLYWDDLDDSEAAEVIRKLEYCMATPDTACVLNGSTGQVNFRATLPKPGFTISHTMKIPGQHHFREYQRDKDAERIKKGRVESHSNLALSESLYDELALSSDGYAGSVPVVHKDFAVRLLMERFAEEVAKLDEPDPEEQAPETDQGRPSADSGA